jgi:hypothetical protein
MERDSIATSREVNPLRLPYYCVGSHEAGSRRICRNQHGGQKSDRKLGRKSSRKDRECVACEQDVSGDVSSLVRQCSAGAKCLFLRQSSKLIVCDGYDEQEPHDRKWGSKDCLLFLSVFSLIAAWLGLCEEAERSTRCVCVCVIGCV